MESESMICSIKRIYAFLPASGTFSDTHIVLSSWIAASVASKAHYASCLTTHFVVWMLRLKF